MRVIYILWLRQMKRYLRSRARVISSLAQPLLYLVGMGYGLSAVFAAAGKGNYIQFIAPGLVAMTILFTSIFSGIELIFDRQFGFLKETLVAPVPRLWIIFGRVLGGATVATMQGLLFLLVCLLFGVKPQSLAALPQALVFMALISLVFCALGAAIGSVLNDMQGFQLIMGFLVMPIFFLSGAMYPLQGLPSFISYLTTIDPLTYGVDALRQSLNGAAMGHYSLLTDFGVLGLMAALLLILSSYLFSKIQA